LTPTAKLFFTALLALRADAWVVEYPCSRQDEGFEESEDLKLSQAPTEARAGRAAIQRALDWLAKQQAQQPDGSLPATGATQEAPLAITALSALAWMAGGSTPERGPHGVPLASAIDYLLGRVDLDPESKNYGYISDGRDQLSRMHGHGFATLALAEAYAMSPKSPRGRRIERALKLAIYRIEISQGAEGGWYYSPLRSLQHEGSVTIALVQALRAARNSGMRVNAEVIAKAVDYVRRSQAEDGSFRYAIGHEMTSVALTAAAISTLNATGIYSGEEVLRGYDYIQRELAARETADIEKFGASYPLYQNLYLAQAYWQHPEHQVFEGWFTRQRAALLRGQDESGAWSSKELAEVKSFGATYATATNALILALPEGLLPIFQR
jgi:hypothetical protein